MGSLRHCSLVIILLYSHALFSQAKPLNQPLLLMVGFDSFRWDFLDRGSTPNFDHVASTGIRAEHLVNVFPTKSSPNWYSLMTGLYPESHGVVNNHIYEPLINKTAPLLMIESVTDDPIAWDQAEPIWITNERQGGSSAVFQFLWGMGVNYSGVITDYHTEPGAQEVEPELLVDRMVDLFSQGSINLGLIYLPDVDHACHHHGPESRNVTDTIERMDKVVGHLLGKVADSDLHDRLNILFVADHGQVSMKPSQVVFLNDHVDPSLYLGYQDNPMYSIFPNKDGDMQTIYDKLSIVEHIDVWTKDTIPEEYHYRNNERIPPLMVMTEIGWNVAQSEDEEPYWKKTIGEHGYPNNVSEMWPFFLAMGPSFRRGILSEPFSTLDVYSLACHILRIEPRPHNGSLENVKHLLLYDVSVGSSGPHGLFQGFLLICVVVIVFLVAGLLATCSKLIKYRGTALRATPIETEGLLSDEDL